MTDKEKNEELFRKIIEESERNEELKRSREAYRALGISDNVFFYGEEIEDSLADCFAAIDRVAERNQLGVIRAMQECRVSTECFQSSSGYGYDDIGRDTLESVYAACFHGEAALVRQQITCGTHALALSMMANLRPGDEVLSPLGKPYDTMESVIGIRPAPGSLAEYGITYRQVELREDGTPDLAQIQEAICDETKLILIQRSSGYQTRPTFSVGEIGSLIETIRSVKSDVICMVDNCYGEFVEEREPLEVGADLIVGSLIKNPGGGLAETGGYLVGKKEYVDNAAFRLTSPGLGREVGASLGASRSFYQGLFLAPQAVASALKGALFAAALYDGLGFSVFPEPDAPRSDIIQSITLGSKERVIAFCRGIQAAAPVDAHVLPEPWNMPGYEDPVIMAAGAFAQGSSIELSADAPIREPYRVYLQGGLTWPHAKLGALRSLEELRAEDLLENTL